MSKLLINEPPLQVLPSLAAKIGLNEAIFLQQLHYWLQRSSVEALDCRWVHNTTADWAEQFPFWSEKTIRRTVDSLREQGLVSTVRLKAGTHDQTLFYTIAYGRLDNLGGQIGADACGQNDHIDKDKMTGCHVVKMTNSSVYENTETTTEIHTSPGGDLPTIKPRTGINHKAVVDLYNKLLPELPRCKVLTEKRKAAINGCCSVKDTFKSLDFWEAYFSAVRKSDFLMGRSKDWKADFDFLTTKSKFVKVYEGGYK